MKNTGLLFLNSRVRFSDIEDGSSNTFLVGEKLDERDGLGWVSGTRATLRNTGVLPLAPSTDLCQPSRESRATRGRFVRQFAHRRHSVCLRRWLCAFHLEQYRVETLSTTWHRADGELMDAADQW